MYVTKQPTNPPHNSGLRRAEGTPILTAPVSPLERHRIIRSGVLTYVFALLLIAAFSITFHFITDSIVTRQQDTARIINLSGRQRMLAQRITRLSLERAARTTFRPDAETNATLNTSIDLMQHSWQALRYGSLRDGLAAPTSPRVLAVYTQAPYALDAQTQDFLTHARNLADTPSSNLSLNDPDLVALEQAVHDPLLNALDAAVTANETSATAAITHLRQVLAAITVLMLCILLAEALFLYRPLFNRLDLAHNELIDLGRTDPLTGCLNRRAFTTESTRALNQAQLTGVPLAVLMIDIDHFKSINDRFGHPAGDLAINSVVATLIRCTRAGNIVCRMGGEEFAILLHNSSLSDAEAAARNLCAAIAAHPISLPLGEDLGNTDVQITVSIGAANLVPSDQSIFTLLNRADKGLYRAKQNGRNRAEAERHVPPAAPHVLSARA